MMRTGKKMRRRRRELGGDDYADVVELVAAGGLRAPPWRIGKPLFRERYSVELDSWDAMTASLLLEVVADARTHSQASAVLGLPPERVAARVRWARGELRGLRESYLVGVGTWEQMSDELLLMATQDVGSLRSAAAVIGVPRSTLGARVARARKRQRSA